MKRIALNGRFTGSHHPTGTQKAAFHLFDQVIRRNRDFELVVFADSHYPGVAEWEDIPGTTFIETPLREWSKGHCQIWEQFQLPQLCRDFGCSVAHHPLTTSPVWKRGCKSVVTLHDLNYLLHPEWYSKSFRMAYRFCATPGLKQAERVVTVSDYVFNQARKILRLPQERLRMVYNGSNPLTPTVPSQPSNSPYILCVSAFPPHKNLSRLIQAFQRIRGEFEGLELHHVGRSQPHISRTNPRLLKLLNSPGVRSFGYLSDEELANAYAGASLYCYPSLEEGFGLPLLEAMSVGTQVLTSNASCLPEVAGPSAILVDPLSIDSIAEGLRQGLLLSPQEKWARSVQGRAWAAHFTWAGTADAYLKIYDEIF